MSWSFFSCKENLVSAGDHVFSFTLFLIPKEVELRAIYGQQLEVCAFKEISGEKNCKLVLKTYYTCIFTNWIVTLRFQILVHMKYAILFVEAVLGD